MIIGVLALQGNFREHIWMLQRCNVEAKEVRLVEDMRDISGLIIPGGESTTIGKLMVQYGFDKAIIERYKQGMPIFGTCAGAILLAKEILGKYVLSSEHSPRGQTRIRLDSACAANPALTRSELNTYLSNKQFSLRLADITVERNAYGRQIDSFETDLDIKGIGKYHAIFIRAPVIKKADCEILATHNNNIVMAKDKNILIATFHPELTDDKRVHEYFIEMVQKP